jgi:hypothetical protein
MYRVLYYSMLTIKILDIGIWFELLNSLVSVSNRIGKHNKLYMQYATYVLSMNAYHDAI